MADAAEGEATAAAAAAAAPAGGADAAAAASSEGAGPSSGEAAKPKREPKGYRKATLKKGDKARRRETPGGVKQRPSRLICGKLSTWAPSPGSPCS